jgi:hypothetical protein
MAIKIIHPDGRSTMVPTRSRAEILEEHKKNTQSEVSRSDSGSVTRGTSADPRLSIHKRWDERARLLKELKESNWSTWVAAGKKKEFDALTKLANEIPFDGYIREYDQWAIRYGNLENAELLGELTRHADADGDRRFPLLRPSAQANKSLPIALSSRVDHDGGGEVKDNGKVLVDSKHSSATPSAKTRQLYEIKRISDGVAPEKRGSGDNDVESAKD